MTNKLEVPQSCVELLFSSIVINILKKYDNNNNSGKKETT